MVRITAEKQFVEQRCRSSLRLLCASCIQGLFSWHGHRCSCLPPCPFPAPAGTSVPVPPPSQGTAVPGLLLELPISRLLGGCRFTSSPGCSCSYTEASVWAAGLLGSVPSSVGLWLDHLRARLPPQRPADAHFLPLKSLWEQSLPTEGTRARIRGWLCRLEVK